MSRLAAGPSHCWCAARPCWPSCHRSVSGSSLFLRRSSPSSAYLQFTAQVGVVHAHAHQSNPTLRSPLHSSEQKKSCVNSLCAGPVILWKPDGMLIAFPLLVPRFFLPIRKSLQNRNVDGMHTCWSHLGVPAHNVKTALPLLRRRMALHRSSSYSMFTAPCVPPQCSG